MVKQKKCLYKFQNFYHLKEVIDICDDINKKVRGKKITKTPNLYIFIVDNCIYAIYQGPDQAKQMLDTMIEFVPIDLTNSLLQKLNIDKLKKNALHVILG